MAETGTQAPANGPATFEELKPMLRPTGVKNGVMKVDKEKCTKCGLCMQNCPFRCWEVDADGHPKMKDEYLCFSCCNCVVPCPADAVSAEQYFEVHGGFFDTDFPSVKMPLPPQDAEGKPAQWTDVERFILERRSVRNFKKTPVPDPLIRRVLEAGRFAPSGGNHQPWKFAVVTDPVLLSQLEETLQGVWAGMRAAFTNDDAVLNLVNMVPTGVFDPRVQNGVGCVARKELPIFFEAPAVIFLGGHERMVDGETAAGICGQNMNLAAMAMGLGCVWSNFGAGVNFVPELKEKLGFGELWKVKTTLCLGYPKFRQQGMVPRHYRPVTWFRPGVAQPEIER